MDRRTKALATAIASAIAFVLLVVNTLSGQEFTLSEEVVNSIATLVAVGVMWFISHYYNQDYSGVAGKITPIMRKVKELEKVGDLRLLDQIEHLIDTWEGDEDDDD